MTDYEGVTPALAEALEKRGYSELTPVQTAVLAPETQGRDLLVSAQTGSGKTVAFGLAIAPTLLAGEDRLGRVKKPLALVVAPTRELALQVCRELEWLYEPCGASVTSCVGGMDMRQERRTLARGVHIVVGTPGRLRDHIERGSLDMSDGRAVVLDEADEMLDLGFRDDLEYILDAAPKERRTLMFSATVPKQIATLAKRFQRDALRLVTAQERQQHGDIEYRALQVAPNDRENAIINVLRYYEAGNALVFCATRATVNRLTSRFANRGFSVVALSGELSQNERTHALQAMRDGRARVCVATDVAARGIDLPNLELVIHADLPGNQEGLLHRSGRTGRAGRKGVSVLIVPYTKRRTATRLLGNAKIEATWAKPPTTEDIVTRDHERILNDPALSTAPTRTEQAFVQELLARHGAEKIAAAFLRQHQKSLPAPEELIDAAPQERKSKARDDFSGGVWLSLSVGRKHNAEPRWLLPMLCRAGHITKNDIGAIRIQQNETQFELTPESAEKFLEAIGPGRKIEKSITVNRLKGAPKETPDPENFPPRRKSYKPKSDRSKSDGPKSDGPKTKPGHESDEKKPWKKRAPSAPGKGKSGGPKSGGPKSGGPKSGSRPMKRKKP